jgi:uncharacterized protein YtpQ (UPF0354 family)
MQFLKNKDRTGLGRKALDLLLPAVLCALAGCGSTRDPAAGTLAQDAAAQTRPAERQERPAGSAPDFGPSWRFTENFAGLARQELPEAQVRVKAPLVLAVNTRQKDFTWYLDNLWREVRNNPAAQREISDRHIATLRGMMADKTLSQVTRDRSTIVPIIKNREGHRVLNLMMEGDGGVVSEPFVGDLVIVYANDSEHSLAYLSEAEFQKLSLPRAELRKLAVRNLARLMPAAEKEASGALNRIVAGGTFEASLLLLDEPWQAERQSVQGRLVAAVPTRDVILYTGTGSPQAIERMRSIIAELTASGNYLVSDQILLRRDDGWTIYDPAMQNPR